MIGARLVTLGQVDTATLEAMAEQVSYEVWMLCGTTDLLNEPAFAVGDELGEISAPMSSADIVVHNALLESSLIHLRALHAFLAKPPKRRRLGDVHAEDYLASWSSRQILSLSERAYINKRVAHVAIERLSGPLPWGMRRTAEAVGAFGGFVEQLGAQSPERALWFPPPPQRIAKHRICVCDEGSKRRTKARSLCVV